MTERTVTTNGVDLHVVDEGDGPVVVLAHGFPELSYSWRHQIPALAAAGYRVLAPDQRGYGRSSRPEAVEDYDIAHLTDDLLGLLDDVGASLGHVRRPRLGRARRVADVAAAPGPGRRRRRHERAVPAPRRDGAGAAHEAWCSPTSSSTSCTSRSPASPTPTSRRDPEATMRRMLGGLAPAPGDEANVGLFSANDGRGFVDRLPEVGRVAGVAVARTSSTTTSPSSPAPGSPAASTGTATWTATGS